MSGTDRVIPKAAHSCRLSLNTKVTQTKDKMIKNQKDNPNGLHQKYVIRKIVGTKNSGFFGDENYVTKAVDPKAEYFLLRLDPGQKDHAHFLACRKGVNAYADAIEKTIPQLAKDIREQWPSPDIFKDMRASGSRIPMMDAFLRDNGWVTVDHHDNWLRSVDVESGKTGFSIGNAYCHAINDEFQRLKQMRLVGNSDSEPLKYGDKVKCSMDSDFNGFWLGTYIGKHPTMDAHIVLTRARADLRISEELDAYAYCKLHNWE